MRTGIHSECAIVVVFLNRARSPWLLWSLIVYLLNVSGVWSIDVSLFNDGEPHGSNVVFKIDYQNTAEPWSCPNSRCVKVKVLLHFIFVYLFIMDPD